MYEYINCGRRKSLRRVRGTDMERFDANRSRIFERNRREIRRRIRNNIDFFSLTLSLSLSIQYTHRVRTADIVLYEWTRSNCYRQSYPRNRCRSFNSPTAALIHIHNIRLIVQNVYTALDTLYWTYRFCVPLFSRICFAKIISHYDFLKHRPSFWWWFSTGCGCRREGGWSHHI